MDERTETAVRSHHGLHCGVRHRDPRGEPDTTGEGYWKVKFMSEPYPEQPDPVENPEVNPLCKPTALGDFRGFKNRDMRAEWDKDYQSWMCQTFVVFDSQREYEQWPVEKFHKDRFANKLENMYSEYRDLVDSPYEPGKLAKVERKKWKSSRRFTMLRKNILKIK